VVGIGVAAVRDRHTVAADELEKAGDLSAFDAAIILGLAEGEGELIVILDLDAVVEDVLGKKQGAFGGRGIVSATVLVCDDALFMRTMVKDILTQAGFTVLGEAENGKAAVEKYQLLNPDLVTMDIIMPEMGGIEAVKKIIEIDPQARILMCSAMGQQALVTEAIQAGAKDFVIKPFQPSRVLESVQRVLG